MCLIDDPRTIALQAAVEAVAIEYLSPGGNTLPTSVVAAAVARAAFNLNENAAIDEIASLIEASEIVTDEQELN